MSSLVRRPLFRRYATYIAGLVSALLVLSGGVAGYFGYRESISTLEALERAKAELAASRIADLIGRLDEDLRLVTNKFTVDGPVDDDDLRLELAVLLRHQPAITELYWIASDGREKFALSRIAPGAVDSGRNWSVDQRFAGTRESVRYIGPVYFRRDSEPYLSLAVTRKPGGPVLVAEVNLKFVWDVISQIDAGTSGAVYVVDRQGQLVSHRDINLVLRRPDLMTLPQVRQAMTGDGRAESWRGEARDIDGSAVFTTAVPIEQLGWTVFAEQSRDAALRPVYASLVRSAVLVLVGVVAAIVASLLLARGMVRPIRQIEARARSIGEGELDQRIELGTRDELDALGSQFNRMAERLQEVRATQEARIAERTRELARANDAKTRFLAAASHDLRQPIHALALFVGQLRASIMSKEAPALVDKVERSVGALEELLEALLDLSKLDLGTVAAQAAPMPLNGLLARIVADYAPAAEAKGLALTLVPTKLWVVSDSLLLERILRNLVANAIRYTNDGRILVGCRRRGDDVDLVVADTGIGIAAAHMPHVFEEFYRAGPLQGGLTGGLGLGLAIVKRLGELLGHRIAVESVPGKGTVVRVRIPRAGPHAHEDAEELLVTPDLRGTRVLVIDDEAPSREALEGLLAQWGCDVVAVEREDEAVAQARARRPDVVLCDLNLADGESGVRLVNRLQREHGAGLACAFITGESAPERLSEARATGHPIAFKPTKPAKLRALIEHLSASVR
jgi:signal transduction histidine kinase